MGRLRHVAFVILAASAPVGAALAAEVTRVATLGEKDNPFDMKLSVRWDRIAEDFTVARERPVDATASPPFGGLQDTAQLRYSRKANVLVSRLAFGLYEDLEFHAELPYVIADEPSWKYATVNGTPADTLPGSIAGPGVDAMNRPCTPAAGSSCFFPVPQTVYHGGVLGDVVAGVKWGLLNDAKDDTTASWVVGVDVTLPTAKLYDPAEGRGTNWVSPHAIPAAPGNVGHKIWQFQFHTALSRRYGLLDPYLLFRYTRSRASSKTFSNCDQAVDMAASVPVAQFTNAGVVNCSSSEWKGESGALLPWMAGGMLGVELIPYEAPEKGQRVSLDLNGSVDYTSQQRFYNALTDATGKLMFTEAHYTLAAQAAMHLRATKFVTFDARASYAYETDHFLSGEDLGKGDPATLGDVTGVTPNEALNPNFDWRWDAPGRRFRMLESGIFTISFAFEMTF